MRKLESLIVPAKIEYLYTCTNLVSSSAKKEGFDEKKIRKIELSTEEALVNIYNHAYREGGGDVEISCMIDQEDHFIVEIKDYGAPFNILDVRDPDINTFNPYHIGGLGIFMIKSLMDNVQYRRESGANILTLIASRNKQ